MAAGDALIPLSPGEMTITLQDMEVIMGVPVDGLPVVRYTYVDD